MTSILLVKVSSLGDVIHNLTVASDLRRRFPDARIDWVVEEAFTDFPRLHPGVTEVIPFALRRWRHHLFDRSTWQEMRAFKERLQSRHYDHILDTQALLKTAAICKLAQGESWGFAADTARDPLAARFYDHTVSLPRGLHTVERYRGLAAAALGYKQDLPLDYGLAVTPFKAAWLPARPYAVLCTATSRDAKLWQEEKWLELAAWLHARGYASVLPAGSPVERERATRLAGAMADAVTVPPMKLTELAAVIKGSAVVVGLDTGLTHIAAALDRLTLAIFTDSDPGHAGAYAGDKGISIGHRGYSPSVAEAITALETLFALTPSPSPIQGEGNVESR